METAEVNMKSFMEHYEACYKNLIDECNSVNHPTHYNQGKYECWDVMQDVFGVEALKHFCKLNSFKYLYRESNKNGSEDIKKAIVYLNKYLELEDCD